jgi:transposase
MGERSMETGKRTEAEGRLFDIKPPESVVGESKRRGTGVPRIESPIRNQIELMPQALDELVAEDHPVRAVWAFIEKLDLKAFEGTIQSVEGGPGRPAADPRVMLALWVYATAEGIGSGRELDRLTREHAAFRWLRGGVSVDYHTLNDFRCGHQKEMDDLLTQIVGVLKKEGLVELVRVAQDGTRVRASAGAASFHREGTLEKHLAEAREQVERLAREADQPAPNRRKQQEVARRRAAMDRQNRLEQALAQMDAVRDAKKTEEKKKEARVSSTDPDARVMKMGDGGYRPAYNFQFATDTATQVIVGVGVTNVGSDYGELPPMLDQIQARVGKLPEEALVDGGFANKESVEAATDRHVTVYAPVQKPRKGGVDPHVPKPSDSKAVADWRCRMGTEEAKTIYRERAATAECVNAIAKAHRGLNAIRVRGAPKALGIGLLFAITHNILRYVALLVGC